MRIFLILLLSTMHGIFTPTGGHCQSAEVIAQRAYDRDDGKDSWSDGRMVLIEASGEEKARKLSIASKDCGERSKRLIRFIEPAAIKNTTFLSIENDEERDDQFLYLPALRRVRRIASDQKDRAFVNSDLSFEDMERRKVERDLFRLIGSDKVIDRDCWVLERSPKNPEDSQYGKVVLSVDKESYLVLRSKMFDKDQTTQIKQFDALSVKVLDGIQTVMESLMVDLRTNHKTRNIIDSIKYNRGLPDDMFSQGYMEKEG